MVPPKAGRLRRDMVPQRSIMGPSFKMPFEIEFPPSAQRARRPPGQSGSRIMVAPAGRGPGASRGCQCSLCRGQSRCRRIVLPGRSTVTENLMPVDPGPASESLPSSTANWCHGRPRRGPGPRRLPRRAADLRVLQLLGDYHVTRLLGQLTAGAPSAAHVYQ